MLYLNKRKDIVMKTPCQKSASHYKKLKSLPFLMRKVLKEGIQIDSRTLQYVVMIHRVTRKLRLATLVDVDCLIAKGYGRGSTLTATTYSEARQQFKKIIKIWTEQSKKCIARTTPGALFY
jgi:hypothetical protein